MKKYSEELLALGEKVISKMMTWPEACVRWQEITGKLMTHSGLRKKYYRAIDELNQDQIQQLSKDTFETYKRFDSGTIEAKKIVELDQDEKQTPRSLLEALGYDPNFYILKWHQCSIWDQKSKKEDKQLYAVKYRIEPLVEPEYQPVDFYTTFMDLLTDKPIECEYIVCDNSHYDSHLNPDLLMECPPVELHLGKLAWDGDSNQNYDSKIASRIFNNITQEIIEEQKIRKCGKIVICVGGDFFNSDTESNTTTHGTPQQNDVRWKKMFENGVELYKTQIEEFTKHFNEIEIRVVAGNHDRLTSYYLYSLLQARYENHAKITFGKHTKEIQEMQFGDNAIFWHHGNVNRNRLIKSIPSEFYELWGKTKYRELHIGHFHKEDVVSDESGLIMRRVSSPTKTDYWHYHNRYVQINQYHTIFVWHKTNGMVYSKNIR